MHTRNVSITQVREQYKLGIRFFDKNKAKSICYFKKGIELFKSLSLNSQKREYSTLVDLNYHLGCAHFNTEDYLVAINAYRRALDCYLFLSSNLNDKEYRTQVEIYINITDAYLHLQRNEEAYETLLYAISAFNKIAKKNDQEKKLTHIDHDPQAFYDHYERKTSYQVYIESPGHINNAKNLNTFYQTKRFDDLCINVKEMHIKPPTAKIDSIQELITQCNNISLDNEKNDDTQMMDIDDASNSASTQSFFYHSKNTSSFLAKDDEDKNGKNFHR